MTDDRSAVPPQPEMDGDDLVRSDPTFDLWRTPRTDLQGVANRASSI